jgi:hypothetical protein
VARLWTKSEGKIPKNITIQVRQMTGLTWVYGPYFSNPSEQNGIFKNIKFKLCEVTGNYIRQTPIQDFERK